MMMPPSQWPSITVISVVGVVLRPVSSTSTPMPCRVPTTRRSTMAPLRRASRPTASFRRCPGWAPLRKVANAEVNFTTSMGVRPSPAGPPMVPRIPEIDLIRLIVSIFFIFILWLRERQMRRNIVQPGQKDAGPIALRHFVAAGKREACSRPPLFHYEKPLSLIVVNCLILLT